MAKEELLMEQLLRRHPEAILVTDGSRSDRARRMQFKDFIPVIESWDPPAYPIGHVVGFSKAAKMHRIVAHMVAKGLTRIAFIGCGTDADTRGADRRCGHLAAMDRHGLVADRLIGAGIPPISMCEGAVAMGRLLDTLSDMHGVGCVSDHSAPLAR